MSGQSSEVIHCPNCKEDVPKTLYCLNCGYPLYKLEQQKKAEEPVEEPVAEPEPVEEVDMSVEIEQPEPVEPIIEPEPESEPEEEPEEEPVIESEPVEEEPVTEPEPEPEEEEPEEELVPETEPEIETTIEVEDEKPEPEPVEEEESEEELVPETEPEIETTIEVEDEKPEPEPVEEEPAPEPEPEDEPISEPELVEEDDTPEPEPEVVEEEELVEEPVVEPEVEKNIFTPEERESYMMDEIRLEFAPDPLTKEVMENLAKNITLKIRLVRLLRENRVKEETFKKLFDSYVDQGRLWVGRRDEIIRRFKADIERMEDDLVNARKAFELLEIRKNIGDASEEEYKVKEPAYKWDIENLDKGIKNTKGSIHYVINLKGLIPEEEVAELKGMADTDYSELDDVEGVTSDTIARMKESLAEALVSIEN